MRPRPWPLQRDPGRHGMKAEPSIRAAGAALKRSAQRPTSLTRSRLIAGIAAVRAPCTNGHLPPWRATGRLKVQISAVDFLAAFREALEDVISADRRAPDWEDKWSDLEDFANDADKD